MLLFRQGSPRRRSAAAEREAIGTLLPVVQAIQPRQRCSSANGLHEDTGSAYALPCADPPGGLFGRTSRSQMLDRRANRQLDRWLAPAQPSLRTARRMKGDVHANRSAPHRPGSARAKIKTAFNCLAQSSPAASSVPPMLGETRRSIRSQPVGTEPEPHQHRRRVNKRRRPACTDRRSCW